jgi:uncharacterized membrane protein YbhN (UPF0104 family)
MADEDTERPRRPRWVNILRMVGGIAVGIGSAMLVARLMGIHWGGVLGALRSARPLPLLAAVGGTFVLIALQALRWGWVVRPVLQGRSLLPRRRATRLRRGRRGAVLEPGPPRP